jgi:hypothetical protein
MSDQNKADRNKAKVRRALSSRNADINDAFQRLYAAFSYSDAASMPPENELAAAARSLRDDYSAVSNAVAKAGTRVPGSGQLADGLAEYSAAYGKLARGLQTSNEGFGNTAFDQMEALLQSAEQKVSSALGRLRL